MTKTQVVKMLARQKAQEWAKNKNVEEITKDEIKNMEKIFKAINASK